MSRQHLIDAAEVVASDATALAESANKFAALLRQSQSAAGASAPQAPAPAAPRPPLPPRKQEESAFTECPAHRKPFEEGRYGLYCTGKGEPDGNWYNDKGYCRVTPKSAGAWLKQHPEGPAPSQPQDVDDVPF